MDNNRQKILISDARALMTTIQIIRINQTRRPDMARIHRLFDKAQARYFRRMAAARQNG